jgi:HSP20 family protein
MTMVRWNPYRDIAAMQRALNRVFDENWHDEQTGFNTQALALDVYESANAYQVTTVLPGVKAENIEINYLDRTLTITAELPQPTLTEGTRPLMNERLYGKYSRSITLPQPVDSEKIAAEYTDGVLTLTLPKAESAKPRQIPVRPLISSNGSNSQN